MLGPYLHKLIPENIFMKYGDGNDFKLLEILEDLYCIS